MVNWLYFNIISFWFSIDPYSARFLVHFVDFRAKTANKRKKNQLFYQFMEYFNDKLNLPVRTRVKAALGDTMNTRTHLI